MVTFTKMEISKNKSLKGYNTFGISASAKYFAELSNVDQIHELLDQKEYKESERMVLGGGSNLLFTQNFNGIVIKNNLVGISLLREDENYYYVKAGAGENWHKFVQHCIKNNYAGVENLSLIPGNVGASPMQNIGAYGAEVKDVIEAVEAFNLETKSVQTFSNSDCQFGYRESIFKHELKNKCIIASVTYRLLKTPKYNTTYGAIEQEMEKMGVKELSVAAISEAVCNIRNSKLPNPAVIGNAGSFFKNPVVEESLYVALKEKHPSISAYPQPDKKVKLAAGWLIEQSGWKGFRKGDAGVHKNQALVLVNYGNATGKEIYDLSTEILASVKEKFGVDLEREVNIV